jgi:glycosyltransferase involved in cell wall biosynthesis
MAQPVTPEHAPRLLIVSHDVVGSRMAGTGIRYWEIAQALATQQPVTLIAPQAIDLEANSLKLGSYAWGDVASLAAWVDAADVVFANGHVLQGHPDLGQIQQPLVLDLYDPTLLENLELFRTAPTDQRNVQHQNDTALLQRQLAAADFFVCATERQRDLYLGALMVAGRLAPELTDQDPELRRLIDVVPFGLPPTPPTKTQPALRGLVPGIANDDIVLLWTGGLWDWMDPQTLVEALPPVVEQHPNLRLVFLAGQHPGNAHPMRVRQETKNRAQLLDLLDRHVFFYDQWVPYQQRANLLLEANIAASLHRPHLESRYAAIRSRILDHLWAGLPSIVSAGDPAAALLEAAGAGLVVEPRNPDQVRDALLQLLNYQALQAAQTQAARKLAQKFTWNRVVKPLAHFCQHPWRTRASLARPESTTIHQQLTNVMEQTYSTLDDQEAALHAVQRAAIAVQDQTWRLQEPLPGKGMLRRLRHVLIKRIVRPLVMPLIELQQEHNLAVLRSITVIAELAEHRRIQLHARVDELSNLVNRLEQQTTEGNDLVKQIEARLAELDKQIEARLVELDKQIEPLTQNDRLMRQQLSEFAEQLAGLEDADTQLLAAISGEDRVPPATSKQEQS